jgi:hypothetical protein
LERLRWGWKTKSRGGKALIVGLVVLGLFAGYGALGGGSDETAEQPPASTTPKTSTPAAPPSTVSARKLVATAKDRKGDDPLRGLPDLHWMAFAYAGDSPDSFSNVVRTLLSAGASMCDLFFGVDSKGWRVVPRTADVAYPNDYFPVRLFTSPPCPAPVGDPDPQNFIQPAPSTTVAS